MKSLVSLITALLLGLPAFAAPKPPNVIFVLTDDQGHGELGCHGNAHIKTPNLDKLHGESVRFTDFHVSPNCTPTWAALMTGNNPVRVGAWSTAFGLSMLREGVPTMADAFAGNGYHTALFGKWHLGDNYPFRPEDRGFQEVLRHGGGGVGQTPDYWGNDYFDDTYFRNGRPEKHTGYCTDVWFDEAMKFITTHRERPFFLYLASNAPHGPLFVPESDAAPYRENTSVVSAKFYGMIANLDANMGRLMDKLRALGLEDDTILIFMTDNGTGSGVKTDEQENVTQGYNSGMRGKKGSYYEGGHRVPFFIRWPAGGLTGGRDIGSLAAHIDLLPTFIELCGLKRPEAAKFDGISLAPVLRGEAKTTPERSLLIRIPRARDKANERAGVVMSEHWRLVGGTMLFDVRADSGQTKDIAAEHPDIVQRLQAAHDKQWAEVFPNAKDFARIVLGHDAENPARLTAFDWHGAAPWNQPAIRNGVEANGSWMVRVEREGMYEVALRRWPEEVKHPITEALPKSPGALPGAAIAATQARLKIGDFDQTQPIPPDAQEIVFQVKLKAGPAELQTWLLDEKSNTSRGAYYVRVERKADTAGASAQRAPNPAMASINDVPGLPRVLIIGDSISIGYTLDVREMLKGKANVHRIPVNGGPTTNGLTNIKKWLGDSHWDVIHFNWGLHDLKYMRTATAKGSPAKAADPQAQVPLADYEKNLAELVKIMQATGAKLIWRTTTPHPTDPEGRVGQYNQAAARVMKAAGIPTDDLNSHAAAKPDSQLPSNVHYSPEGYHYLAQKVAAAIEAALPKK